jgi:hypothetical protein
VRSVVDVVPLGKIYVDVYVGDVRVHALGSPIIEVSGGRSIAIAWTWNEDRALLAVSGTTLASSDHSVVRPARFVVPAESRSKSRERIDSENVARERAQREARRTARSGRHLVPLARNLERLEYRIANLEDDLQRVRDGECRRLMSVADAIRPLICVGGKFMVPLLQRCAGLLDQPLDVYGNVAEGFMRAANGYEPELAVETDIDSRPRGQLRLQDLETWLDQPGMRFGGSTRSNNDVLRMLLDSDAQHHDPSVEEASLFLDASGQRLLRSRETILRVVGVAVAELGRRVLAAA